MDIIYLKISLTRKAARNKRVLLKTLHYIKKDNETDLQKKYYQIKKYNQKLKGTGMTWQIIILLCINTCIHKM